MNICSIDGCNNNVSARKLCNKHYMRWYIHGDPNFIKKSGYEYHSLYVVFFNMKRRCYNVNHKFYKDYGGRGITICDEWKNNTISFIKWCLGNGWKRGLEIDRKDNDGNYCPENCRFVTHKENTHNRRLLRSNNTSGYCGVCFWNGRWIAQITINNKNKTIGYFNTPEEAAIAYDKAVPDNRPRNFK